jgi:hypothetical protein
MGVSVVLPWGATAWADGGITTEGPLTVFRSGTTATNLALEWVQVAPSTNRAPRLVFEFGFATEEEPVPQTFVDSFSVTLQALGAGGGTALLLTADVFGPAWAPSNPGGLLVEATSLSYTNVPFAAVTPSLPLRSAYSVSYLLPPELSGRSVSLFMDFFDNGSALRSLAYVTNVRVESAPDTNRAPAFVVVESTPAPGLPYREEPGAVVDIAGRVVRVPAAPRVQFFRLESEFESEIGRLEVLPDRYRMIYGVRPAGLKVQASAEVEGPYLDVAGAEFDAMEQAMAVPVVSGTRYLRLVSAVALRIKALRWSEGRILLPFDLQPRVLALWSGRTVEGPYIAERAAEVDLGARMVTLPLGGSQRFFRLRSDLPLRITQIRQDGAFYELRYE